MPSGLPLAHLHKDSIDGDYRVEGSEEYQGPEQCKAPDIIAIIEVVRDTRFRFVWPVE